MTGEEIRRRLVDFARRWSLYDGGERAEAQTFLNELFACYGTDRQAAGARFEDPQRGKFLDLVRPHRDVDPAVLAAYGWSSALLDDVRARNRALLDLNRAILSGEVPYAPF